MKVKFLTVILLLTAAGLVLTLGSAYAQDKGLSPGELLDPSHSELNLNDDKTLFFEHDGKSKASGRDSIMLHNKPALNTPVNGKPKNPETKPITAKEEDDALSFNFLYYIIQKFKISDLIDE